MKRARAAKGLRAIGLVGLAWAGAAWAQPALTSSAIGGEQLYRAKGCYECHGLAAQGAIGVAPPLKPPRASIEAFQAYVRRPSGQMPPYSASLLSKAEVEAIFSYLKSLPSTRSAAEIPMLAPFVATASPAVAHPAPRSSGVWSPRIDGGGVYRQYCAACHGANFEGSAAAPPLRDLGGRYSLAQVEALVRNPPARMPRLFPAPLGENDLTAVATYLHKGVP